MTRWPTMSCSRKKLKFDDLPAAKQRESSIIPSGGDNGLSFPLVELTSVSINRHSSVSGGVLLDSIIE